LETEALRGKTVSLLCGIGDPYSFENLIMSLGINIGRSFIFPDHHPYSKKDLENIARETGKKNIDIIVTTEKDAARFPQPSVYSLQQTIFVLRIELKITKNEQEFHNRLLQLYTS
jgi:tetraacyldisaccharide 4'-kinase